MPETPQENAPAVKEPEAHSDTACCKGCREKIDETHEMLRRLLSGVESAMSSAGPLGMFMRGRR